MAHCLLAAFTTLLWLASATGLEPTALLSAVPTPGQSIDLLEALGLYNGTWEGVSLVAGRQQLRPAYYLQGDYRDLKLPPAAFKQVSDLLRRSPEFTISAWLRQETGNTGSIVSFGHGLNRYLELQSSGRKNEVRLHYTSKLDSKVYVETFHFRIADNTWHHVAVSVSGSQVELLVDCNPLYRRLLRPGAPDRNFSAPQQLWLGQRNKHYFFKGAMQEVRLIAGSHGYLAFCPDLDATCPTCGQFSLLQNTVQELTRHLLEISERLVAAEGRISKVEECDCQKACHVNGTVHADGVTWERDCDLCACVHGEVQCRPMECPTLNCTNPVDTGDCCRSCLKQCFMHGVLYDHGDLVSLKQCVECECQDGSMQCKRIDPDTMCPELTCEEDRQFSVPGECCKFCPDVDECKQEGGLFGHHCHSNTKCVNTPGSYVCECLTGYRRVDKFNCAEVDECSTSEHGCDIRAECINTQGSYHCVCQRGYVGDGYRCEPVCNQSCLNGGICRRPGVCSCPNGYTGTSCERDLNECTTNSHRCTDASVCVNMIGWYYCECKPGYRSPVIDNNLGLLCQDINECEEQLHTCHPSAFCENIDGGFLCKCPPDRGKDCKLSCMFEGAEVANGNVVSPVGKPCLRCDCNQGVIACKEPTCNCSLPHTSTNECCPQCDPSRACTHQELPTVRLPHGEMWSYKCQSCECQNGEVDCWDMKCPPLSCEEPVQAPDECCPHCDDLCSFGEANVSSSGQPCDFSGNIYPSGTQFADPKDPCVACNCKDGVLCCSYKLHCANDGRPMGYDGLPATPTTDQPQKAISPAFVLQTISNITKQFINNSSATSSQVSDVSDSRKKEKTEKNDGGGAAG